MFEISIKSKVGHVARKLVSVFHDFFFSSISWSNLQNAPLPSTESVLALLWVYGVPVGRKGE